MIEWMTNDCHCDCDLCRCEGLHREESPAHPAGHRDGLRGVKTVQWVCLQQPQHQGHVWMRRKLQHLSVSVSLPTLLYHHWPTRLRPDVDREEAEERTFPATSFLCRPLAGAWSLNLAFSTGKFQANQQNHLWFFFYILAWYSLMSSSVSQIIVRDLENRCRPLAAAQHFTHKSILESET